MSAVVTVVLVVLVAIAAGLTLLLGKAHSEREEALDKAAGARMALRTVKQSLKWARQEREAALADLAPYRAVAPKPVGRPYGHLRSIDGGRSS